MKQKRYGSLVRWGMVLAVALFGLLALGPRGESRSPDADLESAVATVGSYHDALAARDGLEKSASYSSIFSWRLAAVSSAA